MVAAVRSRAVPITAQRERFRRALVHHAYDAYTRGDPARLRRGGARRRAARRSRVAQGDRRMLALGRRGRARADRCSRSARALARAADGVLDADEQAAAAAAARPRPTRGPRDDLPLLDEAEALLKGGTRQFEHVVVDEAQDLSPMQLRMLARRARRHSMTVLGDLAQATGPASPGSWEETLAHLGRPDERADRRAHDGLPAPGRGARRWRTGCSRAPRPASRRRGRCGPTAIRPTCIASTPDELVEQVAEHAVALVARPRDGRGDRDARARRRAARRARSARRRARRAGRGRARPPDRGRARAAREGSRVRRRDRRGAGRDRRRRARTACGCCSSRSPAPCSTSRSPTPPSSRRSSRS